MGGSRVAGGGARSAAQKLDEVFGGSTPGGDLEHGADQDSDHVAHEGVRRHPEEEEVAFGAPLGVEDVALEADVVGLGGGEGGEVMGAGEGPRADFQGAAVDPVRPPQGAALLEGAGRGPGQDSVAVGAGLGVATGVEPGLDRSRPR